MEERDFGIKVGMKSRDKVWGPDERSLWVCGSIMGSVVGGLVGLVGVTRLDRSGCVVFVILVNASLPRG